MDDPSGNWGERIKEAVSCIGHTLQTKGRVFSSAEKNITVEIGAGIGIGASAAVTIAGVPVEIGTVASITDTMVFQKDEFDIVNTAAVMVGANVAGLFDMSYSIGKEHSFFDSNCNCDILHDPFVKQMNCLASKEFQQVDTTIGISYGAYLGIGAEISIGFDLDAWIEEVIEIFSEPYVGYY